MRFKPCTVDSRGPESHPSVPRIGFASFALDTWCDEIIHHSLNMKSIKGAKLFATRYVDTTSVKMDSSFTRGPCELQRNIF